MSVFTTKRAADLSCGGLLWRLLAEPARWPVANAVVHGRCPLGGHHGLQSKRFIAPAQFRRVRFLATIKRIAGLSPAAMF